MLHDARIVAKREKADMAYLRRILLLRFGASLLSMVRPQSQGRTTMKRYVGIDVAQEQTALGVVDDTGSIISEGNCPTDPDAILETIAAKCGIFRRPMGSGSAP